jgi:hypothetical protein
MLCHWKPSQYHIYFPEINTNNMAHAELVRWYCQGAKHEIFGTKNTNIPTVSIGIGWRAEVRFSTAVRDISLYHSVQNGSGALFPGVSGRREIIIHFHVVPIQNKIS